MSDIRSVWLEKLRASQAAPLPELEPGDVSGQTVVVTGGNTGKFVLSMCSVSHLRRTATHG